MDRDISWVTVPGGEYVIGVDEDSPEYEQLQYVLGNESPQRRISVSEFRMMTTTVTVAHWKDFVAESGYEWKLFGKVKKVSEDDSSPITYVSWHDAMAFCKWASAVQQRALTLPTEAQWEAACRGPNGNLRPWPATDAEIVEFKNQFHHGAMKNRSVYGGPEWLTPCGCRGFWTGVSEWCLDWLGWDYEWVQDGTVDLMGEAPPEERGLRGGSPISPGGSECVFRNSEKPNKRHQCIGFRMVWNLEE